METWAGMDEWGGDCGREKNMLIGYITSSDDMWKKSLAIFDA
jgi:hypothetical protein